MTFEIVKTLFLALLASSTALSAPLKAVSAGAETTVAEEKLKTLKKHDVKITDALESKGATKKTIEYSGYDTKEVLDLAFGGRDKWAKTTEILFECADGYKAKVPTSHLLKSEGYLVFERKGDPTFSLVNHTQGGKKVKLAPYYLVWNDEKLQNIPSSGFWPYQVVGVRLAETTKK